MINCQTVLIIYLFSGVISAAISGYCLSSMNHPENLLPKYVFICCCPVINTLYPIIQFFKYLDTFGKTLRNMLDWFKEVFSLIIKK